MDCCSAYPFCACPRRAASSECGAQFLATANDTHTSHTYTCHRKRGIHLIHRDGDTTYFRLPFRSGAWIREEAKP